MAVLRSFSAFTAETFVLAASHSNYTNNRMNTITEVKFLALFGTTPAYCRVLWEQIGPPSNAELRHLLFALLFLKMYGNEEQNAAIFHVSVRTFRMWSWVFIKLIAALPTIQWANRHIGGRYLGCAVSVDGTDCAIEEPEPFHRKWFSHKLRSAGLRYEVAVSMTGNIVWVNGPYTRGSHPDVVIFRDLLKTKLLQNELVLADKGYVDGCCVT
eukprot:IDg23599t1